MAPDLIAEYRQVMDATQPGKVDSLSLSQIKKYYDFLCSHVALAKNSGPNTLDQHLRRIEELRYAMNSKRHHLTQTLASIGIGLTAVSILVGLARCHADRQLATPPQPGTNATPPTTLESPTEATETTQPTATEPTDSATDTPTEPPQTEESPPLSPTP
jgi:hypothetical protein